MTKGRPPVSNHGGTVKWVRVTYVQSPEVLIKKVLAIPQWIDSPHTEFQDFNVAEIENEVPIMMST